MSMHSRFGLRKIILVVTASLLVLPLISNLGLSQPANAASSLDLSAEQQTQSITDYNVLRVCVAKHMYGDINTKASDNTNATPTDISWFDTDTAFVVYGSPNGKTCNNIMADALKLWGFKADGSDFLTKMGYTFQATGSNAPRYHGSADGATRLAKYESLVQSVAFKSKFTGDAPLSGATKYYANKTALSICNASSLGLYSSLNSTQQSWVDSKHSDGNTTYTKVTLANGDGTTAVYGYTYDNTVNGPFLYGAASEYLKGNSGQAKTTCPEALSSVSSSAQAAATAAAAETCKQTFSTTSEINACAAGASNPYSITYCSKYNAKNDRTACFAGQGNSGGEQCYELGYTSADTLQACVNGIKHASDNTYCTTTYPAKSYSVANGGVIDQTAEQNACKKGSLIQPGTVITFEEGGCNINPSASGCSTSSGDNTTSCSIDGVGWIVCPVVRFIAGITDASYGIVSQMLTTPSGLFNQSSKAGKSTYELWIIMRNLANIAFVIAFLIIIYSQLTGAGINNYGIKKMLPKLIVAAVLVNLSYWLCAIAVDISNILGISVKGVVDGLAKSAYQDGGAIASANNPVWDGLALTAVGAGLAAGVAFSYISIAIFFPMIIAAILAIITVVLVLTLRQALIIILIIISPLAFVALLLPNTESLFKKWLKLLETLLLLFPIVSLIFGGSALAGAAVTNSANGNFILEVMGAGITIIPLFITPIVMKFAGGVLNKFGGAINNPNKGPIDRLRKVGDKFRERDLDRMRGNKFGRATKMLEGEGRGMGGQYSMRRKIGAFLASGGSTFVKDEAEKSKFMKAIADEKSQEYFAERALNDDGFAQHIAGGDKKMESGVKASAQSVVDKIKTEEVTNREILFRAQFDPRKLQEDAQKAFEEAVGKGDDVGARAATRILLNSGSPGLNMLSDSIKSVEANGTLGDSVSAAIRRDLNGAGLKSRDNALAKWSYTANSLENLAGATDTYKTLTDKEIATQTTDRFKQAAASRAISVDRAQAMLDSDALRGDLDEAKRETLKSIVKGTITYDLNSVAPSPSAAPAQTNPSAPQPIPPASNAQPVPQAPIATQPSSTPVQPSTPQAPPNSPMSNYAPRQNGPDDFNVPHDMK